MRPAPWLAVAALFAFAPALLAAPAEAAYPHPSRLPRSVARATRAHG